MRNGKLLELTMQELPTEEKGGSALPIGNWPTPTVADTYTGNLKSTQIKEGSMHSVTLPTAVMKYPKEVSTTHQDPQTHPDGSTCSVSCRRLNPLFVEYLMMGKNYIGWTDLKPLGTQSLGRQELSHSDSVSKGQES